MFKCLNPGHVRIKADVEQTIELAAKHGFGGIEVGIGAIADRVEADGAAAVTGPLQEAGLRMESFGLPVEFRKDEGTYQSSMTELPRLAAAAEAVGLTRCSTYILPFHNELDFERNFAQHAARLTPVARQLGEHGIRFGLEYVGPKTLRAGKPHEFIHDMRGMLRLCEATGEPNMGLLLDSFHWHCARESADDIRALSAEQIVLVHVNDAKPGRAPEEQVDNERELPGETGVIDLSGFMSSVASAGYAGPVIVEPFRNDLADQPADEVAARVSRSLDRAMPAGL